MRVILCNLIMAVTLLTTRAAGQVRSVQGIVVDSANGKALQGAIVYANRDPDVPRTGKDGKFSLSVESRESFFVVRLPGYTPAKIDWTAADSAGTVTVRLHKVKTDADRFAIQAEDLRVYPQLTRFYDRKYNLTRGVFLTPDDVALRGTASVTDIVRRTPGLQKMCVVIRGQYDCGRIGDRGPTTLLNQPAQEQVCPVSVWYYGLIGPRPELEEVRMNEIVALEGYESPAVTPSEFQGGQCSALVLWMKSVIQ